MMLIILYIKLFLITTASIYSLYSGSYFLFLLAIFTWILCIISIMKKKNLFVEAKIKRNAFYLQSILMILNLSLCYGMKISFGLKDMISLSWEFIFGGSKPSIDSWLKKIDGLDYNVLSAQEIIILYNNSDKYQDFKVNLKCEVINKYIYNLNSKIEKLEVYNTMAKNETISIYDMIEKTSSFISLSAYSNVALWAATGAALLLSSFTIKYLYQSNKESINIHSEGIKTIEIQNKLLNNALNERVTTSLFEKSILNMKDMIDCIYLNISENQNISQENILKLNISIRELNLQYNTLKERISQIQNMGFLNVGEMDELVTKVEYLSQNIEAMKPIIKDVSEYIIDIIDTNNTN